MCRTIAFAFLCAILATSDVHASKATGYSDVVTKLYQEATLSCTIPFSLPATCQWKFEDDNIVTSDDEREIILSSDYTNCTLRFKNVKIENLGTYTCIIAYADGSTVAQGTATLESVASVDYFSNSVSVVEGEATELVCKPWGNPPPRVTWHKRDLTTGLFTDIDELDPRFTFSKIGDIDGAILHIGDAQLTDRANYYCNATNSHGQGSNYVLLRVKSKLAPLWPAIGIIVEVFVLALIIIIYEIYKRKMAKKSGDDQPVSKTE